jgi:hypothetical protein
VIRSERLGRTSLADVEETLRMLDHVLADNTREMEHYPVGPVLQVLRAVGGHVMAPTDTFCSADRSPNDLWAYLESLSGPSESCLAARVNIHVIREFNRSAFFMAWRQLSDSPFHIGALFSRRDPKSSVLVRLQQQLNPPDVPRECVAVNTGIVQKSKDTSVVAE